MGLLNQTFTRLLLKCTNLNVFIILYVAYHELCTLLTMKDCILTIPKEGSIAADHVTDPFNSIHVAFVCETEWNFIVSLRVKG